MNGLRLRTSSFFDPRPVMTPAEWCCANLRFNEPTNSGAFTLSGCEYNREPLNSFADDNITDRVLVYGSQAKKTGTLMGAALWAVCNVMVRLFWVMPSISLAQKFSRTRLMPMCRVSRAVAPLIPVGQHRYDFKTLELQLGNSIIDIAGSNSPANLSSTPANWVFQDEVDKFDEGGREEADASNLADQRSKDQANPKRVKTSTPTLVDRLIWQEFLKTDQRRRFMPCPHCGEFVLLAWSKTTVLPHPACSFVAWDQRANLKDHKHDLDMVKRTAHAVCPWCKGKILDAHKTVMDRKGEWRPTATAASGFRGWHLPSFYANTPNTTFGAIAQRFLQSKASLQGAQGVINGDFAEPWESQDSRGERIEIIVRDADKKPLAESVTRLMTVDNQQRIPHRWYVVRDWTRTGDSRLVDCGHCDEWTELEKIQTQHGVANNHVGLDAGDQEAKESLYQSDVYSACLAHGEILRPPNMRVGLHRGWMPMRGQRREWKGKDKKTGMFKPYGLELASIPRKDLVLHFLAFNGETMLDILDQLRKGPDKAAGIRWELNETADDEYFRHLDGKVKGDLKQGRTWHERSHRWPDHLLDCEKMQVALAMFHRLLPWGPTK